MEKPIAGNSGFWQGQLGQSQGNALTYEDIRRIIELQQPREDAYLAAKIKEHVAKIRLIGKKFLEDLKAADLEGDIQVTPIQWLLICAGLNIDFKGPLKWYGHNIVNVNTEVPVVIAGHTYEQSELQGQGYNIIRSYPDNDPETGYKYRIQQYQQITAATPRFTSTGTVNTTTPNSVTYILDPTSGQWIPYTNK